MNPLEWSLSCYMSIFQRLLKIITTRSMFERIKEDTEKWEMTCSCGHSENVWNYGGIRYLAYGESMVFTRCRGCRKFRMLKMHKP